MNTITKFFTEAPSITEMYYAIIGLSLLGFFIFGFLPEKIALKLFVPHQLISRRAFLHLRDKREFDWSTALKRQSILLLGVSVFSVITLLLTIVYGTIVAKAGLGILALVFILGGVWVDPIIK